MNMRALKYSLFVLCLLTSTASAQNDPMNVQMKRHDIDVAFGAPTIHSFCHTYHHWKDRLLDSGSYEDRERGSNYSLGIGYFYRPGKHLAIGIMAGTTMFDEKFKATTESSRRFQFKQRTFYAMPAIKWIWGEAPHHALRIYSKGAIGITRLHEYTTGWQEDPLIPLGQHRNKLAYQFSPICIGAVGMAFELGIGTTGIMTMGLSIGL